MHKRTINNVLAVLLYMVGEWVGGWVDGVLYVLLLEYY